jgi:uncharacterized membrane protein
MKYLLVTEAPPYVPPVLEEGMEAPTPPTQKELNLARAKELSAHIWQNMVGDTAGNTTKYYCGVLQHADGRCALQVPGESSEQEVDGEVVKYFSDTAKLSLLADTDALVDAVGDAVTEPEREALRDALRARKGKTASVLQFAEETPSLAARLKSKADLDADGWFPDPQAP